MDRVILVFCAVMLMSQFGFDLVMARKRFDGTSEISERDEDDTKYSLLAHKQERRKKGIRKESYKKSDQELAELLEAYEDSPLALVAINGNDKLVCKNIKGDIGNNFIPRLGRNIDDDLSKENEKWLQDIDNVVDYMIERSPPFAPRLGKRKSLYGPRFGREL